MVPPELPANCAAYLIAFSAGCEKSVGTTIRFSLRDETTEPLEPALTLQFTFRVEHRLSPPGLEFPKRFVFIIRFITLVRGPCIMFGRRCSPLSSLQSGSGKATDCYLRIAKAPTSTPSPSAIPID